MNKLFAFGCSMTRGDALDDIWDFELKQTDPDAGPSKYSWPQILANNMNLDCVNLGESGASNKQIWYRLVTTHMTEVDIAFVQWTSVNRWCVLNDDKIQQINSFRTSKQSLAYYGNLHTDIDSDYDANLRMSHADYHAKSIGVKLYHLTFDKSSLSDNLPFNTTETLNSDLHELQRDIHKEYTTDTQDFNTGHSMTRGSANDKTDKKLGHPCAITHKLHAYNLYEEIS